MAFEITDHQRVYVPKGELRGLFNVVRSDESTTEGETRYYAYMNEVGSYIIQRVRTSGSLVIKVYDYFARPFNSAQNSIDTDWTARVINSYVEYKTLFPTVST
jgi:hypothetical protein